MHMRYIEKKTIACYEGTNLIAIYDIINELLKKTINEKVYAFSHAEVATQIIYM